MGYLITDGRRFGRFDAGICAAAAGLVLFWAIIGTVVWRLT